MHLFLRKFCKTNQLQIKICQLLKGLNFEPNP